MTPQVGPAPPVVLQPRPEGPAARFRPDRRPGGCRRTSNATPQPNKAAVGLISDGGSTFSGFRGERRPEIRLLSNLTGGCPLLTQNPDRRLTNPPWRTSSLATNAGWCRSSTPLPQEIELLA